MNNCPGCATRMLRHIRDNKISWYCSYCHQEMPKIISVKTLQLLTNNQSEKLEKI